MILTKGYAAFNKKRPLKIWEFERRDPAAGEVLIEILYCGVCHSDIHQVRNEWHNAKYPLVPGHEIIGKVAKLGNDAKKFGVGDIVGIGCMISSCKECHSCRQGFQQFCEKNETTYTANSFNRISNEVTKGGYSEYIVADEAFLLKIPQQLPICAVAPLLCAGITAYSAIKKWAIGEGHKIAILGMGGVGHMAIKFALSFGAEVSVLSTSSHKEEDAKKMGATYFHVINHKVPLDELLRTFDFILDTISAAHNYNYYLRTLKTNGVYICLGIASDQLTISSKLLLSFNRTFTGSVIGGIAETQEMLEYCDRCNLVPEVEIVDIHSINEVFERVVRGTVRYRAVIDMKTLVNPQILKSPSGLFEKINIFKKLYNALLKQLSYR